MVSFGLRGPWLVPSSKVGSLSKPSVGTFVTEGYLPRPFEGLVLLACAPGRAVASFGPPKVGFLALGDLASDGRPSGVLAFFRWSPANELGSVSEGGIDLRESIRRSNPQQLGRVVSKPNVLLTCHMETARRNRGLGLVSPSRAALLAAAAMLQSRSRDAMPDCQSMPLFGFAL